MQKRKQLFFDTEFTGLHQQTTLISIGFVAEGGQSFYAEFTDYDESQVNEWVAENVIKRLKFESKSESYLEIVDQGKWQVRGDNEWVKIQLVKFLNQFDAIEIWSDNLAYDWVLFCQIFGHAFNIPKQVYYIPFDLATLFKIKNIDPDIKREVYVADLLLDSKEIEKHNALWDAELVKLCYEKACQNE